MTFLLNGVIIVSIIVIGYFSYTTLAARSSGFPKQISHSDSLQQRIGAAIQLDILNGCGKKGVGAKCTSFLRANGFDVVEMKNYKTFNVHETLVIDRVGNLSAARNVARALGVPDRNVVQQLNSDYFVDVSVLLGEDYLHLKGFK